MTNLAFIDPALQPKPEEFKFDLRKLNQRGADQCRPLIQGGSDVDGSIEIMTSYV